MEDAESQAPGSPAESKSTLSLDPLAFWEMLLWTSWNIAPCLVSSALIFFPQLQSNSDLKKKPTTQSCKWSFWKELLLRFPPPSPEATLWKGGGTPRRSVACLPLSEPAVPQRGAGHAAMHSVGAWSTWAGWLASSQMWRTSVPLSELGEMDRPNHFLRFRASSPKLAWL